MISTIDTLLYPSCRICYALYNQNKVISMMAKAIEKAKNYPKYDLKCHGCQVLVDKTIEEAFSKKIELYCHYCATNKNIFIYPLTE